MIPLSKPWINEDDIAQVNEVLKSGRLSLGPKLEQFENEFSSLMGTKYAVGLNSGTSGLHLCVKALGIGQGDEVITSPFSFVASANCLLYEKAKPVFVDVDEDTYNMDPGLIKEKITKQTKALLPVHIFGQSCDMTKMMSIASEHNLKVVEDACESPLATHNGKTAGSFGDAGVFAFYPNKQMTTGEGGMITTDNEELAAFCKSMRNQGRSTNAQWLVHERLGFNYRMDEMSAALGLSQTRRLREIVKKRQEVAKIYMDELAGTQGLILPKTAQGNNHTWFVFPVRVSSLRRDKVIEELHKAGIASKAYFSPPIHLQPFYQKEFGFREGDFPITEKLSRETLILPFYSQIEQEQVLKVCSNLKQILSNR